MSIQMDQRELLEVGVPRETSIQIEWREIPKVGVPIETSKQTEQKELPEVRVPIENSIQTRSILLLEDEHANPNAMIRNLISCFPSWDWCQPRQWCYDKVNMTTWHGECTSVHAQMPTKWSHTVELNSNVEEVTKEQVDPPLVFNVEP